MKHFSNNSVLIGVGLKNQHADQILQSDSNLPDFFEVHAENYFNSGGLNHAVLKRIAENSRLSVHGTGLGLGNHCGIEDSHLENFKRVIDEYKPLLVSEHLCFTQAVIDGKRIHTGDLLPLVRNNATLNICINNIDKVQNAIGRTILVENICHYLELDGHEFEETEFLNEICRLSGCQLLVDINNVYVNGTNFSQQGGLQFARHWLSQINPHYIGQYHVAGSSDSTVNGLVVDDHGSQVQEDVWALLRYAGQHRGLAPTLIEWDTQVPDWSVLALEATKARQLLNGLVRHD